MRILIGALAVALLAGCSTGPVSVSTAKTAAPAKVYAYQTKLAGSSGTLILVRDSGYIGGGCDMGIYVDGQLAARLATKEKVGLQLPAGQHVIGAGIVGSGICAMGNDRREREIAISDGKTSSYRVFTSTDGDVDLLPTTF